MSEAREATPLIVGLGGVDAGGRWGGPSNPAFQSMVFDREELPADVALEQLRLMEVAHRLDGGLYRHVPDGAQLSAEQLIARYRNDIKKNLFIRKVSYDSQRVPTLRKLRARVIIVAREDLPEQLEPGWEVVGEESDGSVRIELPDDGEIYSWSTQSARVSSAGMIPEGFKPCPDDVPGPARRRVARNLWMSLFAVNDAMKSAGLSFEEITSRIPQDQVGIYFASAMGQVCPKGFYGYIRASLLGERPESTQIPFSLTNTTASFVAAYTTGSVGHISSDVGACATFMLNLHNARRDILSGKRRFAIVGSSDAAIYPWMLAGYDVMKALARDSDLPTDDDGAPIYSMASRPFGKGRSGFVIGEGAFAVLLTDPKLALELGLPARAMVCDVACHSDGWKKSISSPGVGDYPALHGVLSSVVKQFGMDTLRNHSFVSAHGSSTPQNGVTEAQLYHRFATTFGIPKWRINAFKSYVGHSMGAAGGMQTVGNLLSLERGVIPRIRNLDKVGVDADLEHPNLEFLVDNHSFEPGDMKIAIGVSKGFGGFNVAQALAGPDLARQHLLASASSSDQSRYQDALEKRAATAARNEDAYLSGRHMIDYDSNRPLTTDQVGLPSPGRQTIEGYTPFDFGID